MFTRIAGLLVAVSLLTPVARADTKERPAELQGAWRLMSVEAEAGSVGVPDARPELVIKGERVLYSGEEIARIDADARGRPKVLDLRFINPERVFEGVYAVEGESLKVCLNGRTEGAKERPQSFSLKDRPDWRLLSFERVKAGETVAARGYVGLSLRFDEKDKEVIVNAALDGGPAKKAGVRSDDVLLEVGGRPVTSLRLAVEAVRSAKPRSELALRIRRDGKERDVTVKVALLPFIVLAGLE